MLYSVKKTFADRFNLSVVYFFIINLLLLSITSCGEDDKKDKIVFGQAVSQSGFLKLVADSTSTPIYEMWIEEVNDAGGIYIKEYDKKLPLELKRYDDESDTSKMLTFLEKLIIEDKVDLILPPVSTNMLEEAAKLANSLAYILLGSAGGAVKLKSIMSGLPYFFSVLNCADTQMPALADVIEEAGITKVAVVSIEDLFGIEYHDELEKALTAKNISIVSDTKIALLTTEFSALFTAANTAGAEAFVAFTYPDETFAVTTEALRDEYNPKIFFAGVGTSYAIPYTILYADPTDASITGTDAIDGVMGAGAWNAKTSAKAAAFEAKYIAKYQSPPEYWGHLMYYSSLEFFQQAIEQAGTLDQS
ncbi:MAG: ABC transporter substrate-binding protein, partial [Deltaproteobacteria bacterium]|nr:ABC transporter substrate-binding protein [Deltaproteobacteria bacterium]